MSVILGINCKLYRGAAGTTAATEMKNVKDVSIPIESGEADTTTRAANGWKSAIATLKDASIEWSMLYDTSDTDLTAISTAYFGGTAIALFASDGSGAGLDCDATITKFDIEQNLEDAATVSITAKPTNIGGSSGRAPSWKTSSAT